MYPEIQPSNSGPASLYGTKSPRSGINVVEASEPGPDHLTANISKSAEIKECVYTSSTPRGSPGLRGLKGSLERIGHSASCTRCIIRAPFSHRFTRILMRDPIDSDRNDSLFALIVSKFRMDSVASRRCYTEFYSQLPAASVNPLAVG